MSGKVKKETSQKKRKNPEKKITWNCFHREGFFQRRISAENILFKPATLVHRAHEKTNCIVDIDIELAIGPKFTNAFTIICTADSRIIYPTFQRFKGRL